jgi:hypothetical protein
MAVCCCLRLRSSFVAFASFFVVTLPLFFVVILSAAKDPAFALRPCRYPNTYYAHPSERTSKSSNRKTAKQKN